MDFPRKSDSTKKRTRKRSYTRKASLSRSFINMVEARREIANALHLHRSSSSPSPSPSPVKISSNPTVLCSSSSHNQLTDSMPIPEPTWSTTAPAVPTVGVLEVEWFDNVSPSYSWWLGFLNSLDGKKEERKEVLGRCLGVEKSDSDGDQNPFMDEWVIFPASTEEQFM